MIKPVWKRLSAPGRKSDIVMALVLILLFISFEISDRSSDDIFRHILAAFLFLWMYMRYMKPADYAVDTLTDALKEHGIATKVGNDHLDIAESARERLDLYSVEVAQLRQEQQFMKDQRLAELSKAHQDLLVHHRSTKKMLGAFRTEEVFDALLKGVKDGLGFHGTVLGILDREGNLVFREDFDFTAGPLTVQIPAWSEGSVLANTLWTGNPVFSQSILEHPHIQEDRAVIGEGPFFLIPVMRKLAAKNKRCWLEDHDDCIAKIPPPALEKRRSCVLCEMFAPIAVIAVRTRPESRTVSPESIVPVVTLVNEASKALEVVELHENLRKMSITDGLTGLINHREFYQQLRRELERARRYRHSVSLLIIDVDDFKGYNDRFGHLSGDLALRKISDILRNCARATDIVARYGGEEFAVILPESTSAGALMLAERIKTDVARYDFLPQAYGEEHLTVSIGIYTAEEGAATEDQIVRLADEAAYSAKNTGKNRVVVKSHA